MKRSLFFVMITGFITLLTLVSSNRIEVPADPKTDAMVADWERAKAYTLEYLTAANNEVVTFRPTPEIRSFAQQMLHLASANYRFGSTASGKAIPSSIGDLEKAADKYNTVETLTKAVMDSYDFMIAAIKETEQSKMTEPITMFGRFEMTREAAFHKAFEHQTHHRGQTTVYLRLKGVKPPNEKLF